MKKHSKKSAAYLPDAKSQTAIAKMILAEDVLRGLEETSMSQSDLAKKISMSRQQLSRLLAASGNATIQTFAQVAAGLDSFLVARIAQPDERVAVLSAEEMEAVHRMRARKEMATFNVEFKIKHGRIQVIPQSGASIEFSQFKNERELHVA